MQFKPSSYSDAAVTAPPTSAASTVPAFDTSMTTAAIQAGTTLFSVGADLYSQERARAEAEQARAAQGRKRKKKKKTTPSAAIAPVPSMPPAMPAEGMPGWMKWTLGIAGVAVVGFVAWKMLGGQEERAPAPRRAFSVAPKKNPGTKLKPVKSAPASSVSMFRDEKTERLIDEAVEEAHGDSYDAEPAAFEMGENEEEE